MERNSEPDQPPGSGSICDAVCLAMRCPLWVKSGHRWTRSPCPAKCQ